MNSHLRPATIEALASFRRRREYLLKKRSLLVAGTVLLLLLLVIALLDRAVFMSDTLRHSLSYGSYVLALISGGWFFLRLLRQTKTEESTAQLMETADPALHEKLFSAVELSHVHQENDSEEFRAHLQDDVAGHLGSFNAETALPTRLLRPWFVRLFGVAALVLLLCFVPALHLPGFLARAALPFANIGRPSTIKIKIVTPVNPNALVPMASTLPLGVTVEGTPKSVEVEIQGEEGQSSVLEMSAGRAGIYESLISIGQKDVRYRVMAGDAITPWHTLEARARPRVLSYAKTLTPPAYTGLPEQTLEEDQGDITALEGTKVRVTMKLNQAVDEHTGTLMPDMLPLEVTASRPEELTTEFILDGKSDAWQLALRGSETGFRNDETAPARLQALPDLPPTVVISLPGPQTELRSDDKVEVKGEATDDLGLAKAFLAHAINGAGWQEVPLSDPTGKDAALATTFDLTPLPVKAGDVVLLKLVAADHKGQRTESEPVRLFIVAEKLNLAKREWAAKQRQLAQQAKSLSEEVRDLRKHAEQARKVEQKAEKNADEQAAESAMASVKQSLKSVQERSNDLWEQIKQASREAPNSLERQETQLVGQRIAELRAEHLAQIQTQLEAEKTDAQALRRAADEATSAAHHAAEALEAFASADTAQAAKEALEQLAPHQQRLAEKAIDANRNELEKPKWQEQQRAAVAAARNAQEDLKALGEIFPQRRQEAERLVENLDKKIPGVEKMLEPHTPENKPAPEAIYGQAHELRNATNQARDTARALTEDATNRANEARERLHQQENRALATVENALRELSRAAQEKSGREDQQQNAAKAAAEKLSAAARQMKDQSELREQNSATNNMAALDQNRMGRALEKMAEQMRGDSSPQQAKQTMEQTQALMKNAKALMADAMAQDAQTALKEGEQAMQSGDDTAPQLAAAQAAQSQLRPLAEAMRRAQAENNAANAAQQAADQANRQRDEQRSLAQQESQRQQNNDPSPPNRDQMKRAQEANAAAQQKLAEASEAFSGKVDAARAQVESMTPKLSELAQQAAADLENSQQATAELASKSDNQSGEQTAQDAQALLPQAEANAQQLSDLQAALRQEAAQADLSREGDRQMARTADVGLAQMQQQTPKIAQNLQQAAQASPQQGQQSQALQQASQAQQQTADALEQLASNLQKMEAGEALPQDALAAQKAMEEALGIKEALDQSYAEAQKLAELTQQAGENPQAALAELEKELGKNPSMQRSLADLAQNAAEQSQQSMAATQSPNPPESSQTAAARESAEMARVARHEQRLKQDAAAQQAGKASEQLQKLAAADPAQNNAQTAQQASEAAQSAAQATAQASEAVAESTPATPSLMENAKGMMLAQALDQLDQAANSPGAPQQQAAQEGQQAQQQPGTQQGQQQGQQQQQQQQQQGQQQSAQQSLAQASQAQSQSMAQSRAQGQAPGQQQPPPPQMAQGKQPPNQSPVPQSREGSQQEGAPLLAVPVLTTKKDGDWGRLPSRMAKDLTEATRQEPSPEYRAAIESYYKAIAEKAKK